MIYAQIIQNTIVNTVDIEDIIFIPVFAQGYDMFTRIDNLNPVPSVGWTYNPVSCSFSPPLTAAQCIVYGSMTCGNQIIFQWNALNTQAGIYTSGQTVAFLSYVGQLYQLLSLGYLNDASDAMTIMIADTGTSKTSLYPFLTNDIVESFQLQIQIYLNSQGG